MFHIKNKKNVTIIAACLMLAMFVNAGFDKIKNFQEKTEQLGKKLKIDCEIRRKFLISCAIIIEIVAPVIIVYRLIKGDKASKTLKKLYNISIYSLLLFLAVVTYFYHPPKRERMSPFLTHLSLFGSILLFLNTN